MEIIIIVVVILLLIWLKLHSGHNINPDEVPRAKKFPTHVTKVRDNEDEYEITISLDSDAGSIDYSESNTHLEKTKYDDLFENVEYLPLELSKSIRIKYRSGRGEYTERDIDILELDLAYDNDIMIEAYCNLRHENRSFYVGRMLEIIDLDTGEIIDNKKAFFKKLINDYLLTPKYRRTLKNIEKNKFFDRFKEKNNDILVIMGYIVRVDGSFNKKERNIVYEYMQMLSDSPLLDEELMKKIIRGYGIVSYQTFQSRVRKLGHNPPFDLVEFTEKIIATQKTVSDSEEQALQYLIKRFDVKEDKPKIETTSVAIEPKKECPHCGSENTLKKGKRETKKHINQRYQCNECGKIFSEKLEDVFPT